MISRFAIDTPCPFHYPPKKEMHSARVPSQDELLQIFRRAGFAAYTPLQERLVPALLKGRDIAVEAAAGAGRTVGVVLPLIVGLRGAGLAPQALVLCPSPEDVGKVARAAARIARVVRDAPAFVPLGEIEDPRREQRRLEKGATIVAGTTELVIDNLRRGSLTFADLSTFVIMAPEGDALHDFVKDVQFIVAKIAERRQTVLFTPSALAEDSELAKLLHHPVLIGGAGQPEGAAPTGGHLYVPVDDGARIDVRSRLLARVILGMRVSTAVVYHPPRMDARVIVDTLRASGLRAASLGSGPGAPRGQAERRGIAEALSQRALDVVVVPLGSGPAASELQDVSPSHVVFFDAGGPRPAPGRVRPGAAVIALVDQTQEKDIARLQEAMGVTMSKGQIPGDDEVLRGAIDRIVKRLGEEDAAELAWLRKQIRRQVPLLKRPLFMAALLKAQLPPMSRHAAPKERLAAAAPEQRRPAAAAPVRPSAAPTPRGRFGRNASAGPAPQRAARGEPREPRGEPRGEARAEARGGSVFAQLFVSIGRNRRVFARDLNALFTETLSLAPGDIGGVRVFEKYSFVDIVPARAEEAIAKLSGTELKGRTITVNYAKKKEEKEGA
jgi:hypothetical protein